MSDEWAIKPWRDPKHRGNKMRPKKRCIGCGTMGCITAWGPWCFECNVARMDRIDAAMEKLDRALSPRPHHE